jgi:aminopeptidase N
MSKKRNGSTVESDGPIWLGQRLSNSLDPDGYNAIVYKKACWVLHMLRALMSSPESEAAASPISGSAARAKVGGGAARPDEKFFKMLRDFVLAYRGGNPSTEDFIRHAEKYMTRASDLERNRKLDWFFADWVFGTGIPTYKLHVSTRRLSSSKLVLEGTIDQNDVPPDFEMLVPLVAIYDKDKKVTLGRVAVSESGGHFRFNTSTKPARVAIDEDEILATVR